MKLIFLFYLNILLKFLVHNLIYFIGVVWYFLTKFFNISHFFQLFLLRTLWFWRKWKCLLFLFFYLFDLILCYVNRQILLLKLSILFRRLRVIVFFKRNLLFIKIHNDLTIVNFSLWLLLLSKGKFKGIIWNLFLIYRLCI